MRDIKLKRIDTTVIVVTDSVLTRVLPPGEKGDKIYNKIENLIDRLNSGLLGQANAIITQEKLLNLMIPKIRKKNGNKSSIAEAYELAEDNTTLEEREQKAEEIIEVSDAFDTDEEGFLYLKGHSIPIPMDLVRAMRESINEKDSNYSLESLVNFWRWACMNPNPEARIDLFAWFKTGQFSITEEGLIVAYRCVDVKKKGTSSKITNFINESFTKAKAWKQSPKNYVIMEVDGEYELKNLKKDPSFDVDAEGFVGFLSDLKAELTEDESGDVYTDQYTGRMTIKIGEEVSMPREDCDSDRDASCSRGLHFMSKEYELRLGDTRLIILINPMNVVAFPAYDQSKGRCCAYFPVATALSDDSGELLELEGGSYDFEYANYSLEVLNNLIETVGLKQLQEDGLISDDLTEKDMFISRDEFMDMIKDNVIHAE